MSPDRTVLEHLLDGRDALVHEVKRLTTAIEELDTVIARIGGAATATAGGASALADLNIAQPVKAPVEVDTAAVPVAQSTSKSPAKRATKKVASQPPRSAPAKKSASRARVSVGAATGQKSIRVHVLEMLAADDRDFGLAEIIDRIHAEGIQAHDDAVRSITIKLMKDGRVERVGRGLYRLTRRAPSSAVPEIASPEDASTQATSGSPAVENYVPPLNLSQSWERP